MTPGSYFPSLLQPRRRAEHALLAVVREPLSGEHPCVWLDATYRKVRIDGRVVSQATVVAIGVTTDGERQVLGVDVGPSEERAFWTGFLRGLVKRGLRACGW